MTIHQAVVAGDAGRVRALLAAGAGAAYRDAYDHTALQTAELGLQGEWKQWADASPADYQAVIEGLRRRRGE